MRSTELYCKKIEHPRLGQVYRYFYSSKLAFKVCGSEGIIVRVRLTEAINPTEKDYWAWWDNERKSFSMVYDNRKSVEVCFTYGSKVEEDHGRGKVMQVSIEEIEEVSK